MDDDEHLGKLESAGSARLIRAMDWADRAAVGGSMACMIHCIALPVAIALLPALAPVLNVPEAFHVWMLALTVPIAALALFKSWTLHGQSTPLYLAFSGSALLTAGLFMWTEGAEATVTVLGALLLATAHIANWRLRNACQG